MSEKAALRRAIQKLIKTHKGQRAAADAIGCAQSRVSQMLHGDRPSIQLAIRVARLANVPVATLRPDVDWSFLDLSGAAEAPQGTLTQR